MWLLCALSLHRWAWSQDRVRTLVRVAVKADTADGNVDGVEERWQSLEWCERCGMVRWR